MLKRSAPNCPTGTIIILRDRKSVLEAHKLEIPVIGVIDTNCDPDEIDFPIPGNDDAIRAVKLIVSAMSQAIIEAKQGMIEEVEVDEEVTVEDFQQQEQE